jgi:hypothetical protein
MAAAQRVFQKAVDQATPHIPPTDLAFLTAQVRASDPDLIVSSAAAAQLEKAIEILQARRDKNSAAAELLVDALLVRHALESEYGVPVYLPYERRLDTLMQANAIALEFFGEGSRPQLRVVGPLSQWTSGIKDPAEGMRILDSALEQARRRGDDVTGSVEYLMTTAEHLAWLCREEASAVAAQAQAYQIMDKVRSAHGPTSAQYEKFIVVASPCIGLSGPGEAADAYDIAAARERPPSTNLLRRAQLAYDWAVGSYDWALAEHFYQAATKNFDAIPEPELRARLTRPLRQERVCHLTQRGDAAEAESLAAPLKAEFDASFARMGRGTPGQGNFWLCLIDAQRQQGKFDEAAKTAQTLLERCRATNAPLGPRVRRCDKWALDALATIYLDTGRTNDARNVVQERQKIPRGGLYDLLSFAHTRMLIIDGRAAEAIEPLRQTYGHWLETRPDSTYAAEAL